MMTGTRFLRPVARVREALRGEDGQAMVEYALLVSLVALVAFGAVQLFGLGVSALYVKITAVVH
jgi:Flp pilus assembly pilin Flp